MRRVGSTFVTLWLVFLLPSLVVWGFMVRWSESSAARFESIWRWCADRLAFPLVLSPATDWSWLSLREGTALTATSGFLILTGVWALMIALPLAFIGGWWVWITSRLAKSSPKPTPTSSSLSYMDPYDTTFSLPATTGQPTLSRPSGALYLITLPLALVWSGLRFLFTPRPAAQPLRLWWRPVILTALWVFSLSLVLYWAYLVSLEPRDHLAAARNLTYSVWYGYLDTARVPRLFDARYTEAVWRSLETARSLTRMEWETWTHWWFLDPDLRTAGVLLALRHALAAAVIALVMRIISSIFK